MRLWRITTLVTFLVIIISLVTACGSNTSQTTTQQWKVTRGDVTIKANGSGKVEVDIDSKPSFGTGGKVVKLNVKEGDRVTKGAVLAQLETDNLELALSQAKAAEAQAKLALIQAEVGEARATQDLYSAQFALDQIKAVSDIKDKIMQIEWEIKVMEVNRSQAQATGNSSSVKTLNESIRQKNLELAEQNQKLQDLLAKDEYAGVAPYEVKSFTIGGQRYDRLVVDDVRMKQQQVLLAEKAIEQAKANIEQAKMNLEHAAKAVQVAQKQLNDATITSPINGLVVNVDIQEGDIVSPSAVMNAAAPLYIIDTDSMKVTAQIDEIDIPGVKLGQPVIIKLDSAPDVQYAGTVESISMAPVANPQNTGVIVYEVKVDFNSPPPLEVKQGMSATVDIILDEKKDVLIVPSRAIKLDAQGNPVINIMANDTIETRQVQVGITDGINTEITGGVNAGETVIITRTGETLNIFGQ